MDELVIVPPVNGEGYVELARTKTGRLFRKHLLNMGDLRHPVTGDPVKIDDTFVKSLKKNFDDGICDIVQVPLANDKNEHTEAPDRNIGEVVDIEVKDKKVYAVLDIRDNDKADKLGKTLLGASAMLHLDYTDTKTGNKVGPTLLHSCVTNRPYITGLENYEEIVAATAATTSDTSQGAVLLTTDVVVVPQPTEENDMPDEPIEQQPPAKLTKDELLNVLKSEHGIDVGALQVKAEENTKAATLTQTLIDALSGAGVVKLSNQDGKDTVTNEDVVSAVAELAQNNVTLTNKVGTLERTAAENAVDALIAEGRVMPKQRKGFVELKLTNPTMFNDLVPVEPIIKLTNEDGVTPPEDEAHRKNIDQEITRYVALANGSK